MQSNNFGKVMAERSNVVGQISGEGKNITTHNYCTPICQRMVNNLLSENKFLKTIIKDLRADKKLLIGILESRANTFEEIRSEIELTREIVQSIKD